MKILNVTLAAIPLEEIDPYTTEQAEWKSLLDQVQAALNIAELLNDAFLLDSVNKRLREAEGIRTVLAHIRGQGYTQADRGTEIVNPYESGSMAHYAFEKGVRSAPWKTPAIRHAAGKPL